MRNVQGRPQRHQAFLRIMFGCDKFCTYCIVPSVRGPEQSRPVAEIEAEASKLADQGCLEVTLIGQTVNSYKSVEGDRTYHLADLLYRLHDIEGIRRLKFVTNYPRHMTRELLEAVRDLPKVSPFLHVPAQSGSNVVLQRMKRGYTVEEYREMHAMIREVLPEAAVTSDFIVGFCGETEEDFQQTVALVRDLRFKNSFIFKYSPRPGTKSRRALCRRRSRGGEAAAEQRPAHGPERDQLRGQSADGGPDGGNPRGRPEQGEPEAGGRRRRPPVDRPDSPRPYRRLRRPPQPDRPVGLRRGFRGQCLHAVWTTSGEGVMSGTSMRDGDMGRFQRGTPALLGPPALAFSRPANYCLLHTVYCQPPTL